MATIQKDLALRLLLGGRQIKTAADAAQTMRSIIAVLDHDRDGVFWFTLLYLRVTEAVISDPTWERPEWLNTLVADFAELYFVALAAWVSDDPAIRGHTPAAWRSLFQHRNNQDISRVQFAIAGLTAHIIDDLMWAILSACRQHGVHPRANTPEHRDHLKVNPLLCDVELGTVLEWVGGSLATMRQYVAPYDAQAIMRAIISARDLAWRAAEVIDRSNDTIFALPVRISLLATASTTVRAINRLNLWPRGLDVPFSQR